MNSQKDKRNTKPFYQQPTGVKRGKYKQKLKEQTDLLYNKGSIAEAFILLLAGFETYKDMRVFFYDLFSDKSKSAGTLSQRIKELKEMRVDGKLLVNEQGCHDKWSKKKFVVNYTAASELFIKFLISEVQNAHKKLSDDYSRLEQRRQIVRANLRRKTGHLTNGTSTLALIGMYNGLIVDEFSKQKMFAGDILKQLEKWTRETPDILKRVLFYNIKAYARKLIPTGLNFDNLADFWRGFALGTTKRGLDYYGMPSGDVARKLEELRNLLSDYANLYYFKPEVLVIELPHHTRWLEEIEPQIDSFESEQPEKEMLEGKFAYETDEGVMPKKS